MSTPTQAIFQFAGLRVSLFAPNSRYLGIGTDTLVTPAGQTIVYLQRRFVPSSKLFAVIQQHNVAQGERLDNLAAQFLGDPLLFWRLCDANGVMRAEEIEAPQALGKTLLITLPQGIPAPQNG